ncbi:MAG: hypothetical protein IKV10_02695 [Alphaproteobacteria bacterium]|nr:hypothetical protein [Alphaproteobacteria bacterium]
MKFMKQALISARRAYNHEDVPIGAVIVRDGKIIARGENRYDFSLGTGNRS